MLVPRLFTRVLVATLLVATIAAAVPSRAFAQRDCERLPGLVCGSDMAKQFVVVGAAAAVAAVVYLKFFRSPRGAAPDIELGPSQLVFGDVTVQRSENQALRIANVGATPAVVHAITLSGSPFVLRDASPLPAVVPPQGKLEIAVSFEPASSKPYEGTLVVETRSPDGGGRKTWKVGLRGRGVDASSTALLPRDLAAAARREPRRIRAEPCGAPPCGF